MADKQQHASYNRDFQQLSNDLIEKNLLLELEIVRLIPIFKLR